MKELLQFNYKGKGYTINLSEHAQERMEERGVTAEQVVHNIASITLEELGHLSKHSSEAMIIDKESLVNVVLGFKHSTITVITVIKKKNPYAKKNTYVRSV